jgi:hypothetical protein
MGMTRTALEGEAEAGPQLAADGEVVGGETAQTTVAGDRLRIRAKRLQWTETNQAKLCPHLQSQLQRSQWTTMRRFASFAPRPCSILPLRHVATGPATFAQFE